MNSPADQSITVTIPSDLVESVAFAIGAHAEWFRKDTGHDAEGVAALHVEADRLAVIAESLRMENAPQRSKRRSAIQRRLSLERATLARSIGVDLKMLRQCVDTAIINLAEGDRIDPHLIASSVMLTEQIARWNLVRDIAPMVGNDGDGHPAEELP